MDPMNHSPLWDKVSEDGLIEIGKLRYWINKKKYYRVIHQLVDREKKL